MIVAYLAHPVRGDVAGNLARAKRWLSYLQRAYPDRAFIAPWIAWLESGDDDSDPEVRARGLERCCAVAARAEEFWPVGCGELPLGHITVGMFAERCAAEGGGARVVGDYRHLVEPPVVLSVVRS